MGATPPLWIPAFAGMTKRGAGNDELGGCIRRIEAWA